MLLEATLHHDLLSDFPFQVPSVDLTVMATWARKIITIHISQFCECARCLLQSLTDEDGRNQVETSDSCLLVLAESRVHLREHMIQKWDGDGTPIVLLWSLSWNIGTVSLPCA